MVNKVAIEIARILIEAQIALNKKKEKAVAGENSQNQRPATTQAELAKAEADESQTRHEGLQHQDSDGSSDEPRSTKN